MKVTITEGLILIEGFDRPATAGAVGHSCRTAAQEAAAWAVKRLGEEMEKSLAFYRTGEPIDNIATGD
jgi:hypothetical protein